MPKFPVSFCFSQKAGRTGPSPINDLMRTALEKKDLISLAAGFVDDETLPVGEMARLAGELLADETAGRVALQYGTSAGAPELREALLAHIGELDGVTAGELAVTAENVVVTSGSQQLLYMISDVLLDPGDIVITEWPSYFVYTSVLASLGASVRAVEMDDGGMIVDSLAGVLKKLKADGLLPRVKMVYTCDYYQNPTGLTLAEDRRPAVLELVRQYSTDHRICLLEDAAYRELGYTAAPPRSIKSFERDNTHVALTQTFSKPFSPGLRTGYALLPDDLVGPVLNQKGNHDFGSSNFSQHLLLRAMQDESYHRHVMMLKEQYRRKRDVILAALDEHLGDFAPAETSWTRPTGGIYVFLTLPKAFDTGPGGPLLAAALAEGVLYVPGEYCYGPDPRPAEKNHLRLTFGTVPASQLNEGIARLSRAIRRVAAELI